MKKAAWLLLFVLLPLAGAIAQKPFEGTITMSMLLPGDTAKHVAKMNLKEDKMEMEVDLGLQGLIRLMPDFKEHKMYMAMMSINQGQVLPMPEPAPTSETPIDLKPTGKKLVVAKHKTEGYSLTTPEVEYVLWEAKDMPKDIRDAYAGAIPHLIQEDPNVSAAIKQMLVKNMVPLKIDLSIKIMADQKVSMSFVSAEAKKLDDAVFERPAGMTFAPPPTPPSSQSAPAQGEAPAPQQVPQTPPPEVPPAH